MSWPCSRYRNILSAHETLMFHQTLTFAADFADGAGRGRKETLDTCDAHAQG